jgi:hypothetical protein
MAFEVIESSSTLDHGVVRTSPLDSIGPRIAETL